MQKDNRKHNSPSLKGDAKHSSVVVSKENLAFIVRRTEKLSSALYIVTGLISDLEPIKWGLREKSILLMSDISTTRSLSLFERTQQHVRMQDTVKEIVSLLEITRVANLISHMNCSVLKQEYEALERTMGKTYLPDDSQEIIEQTLAKDNEGDIRSYKGQNKNVFYKPSINRAFSASKMQESSSYKNLDTRAPKYLKKERRADIIVIIKKKGSVSVKDVHSAIQNCSEKTIQRELASLVKDNLLKKEGEKRWSKYSYIS